jgi:hypothetical protein
VARSTNRSTPHYGDHRMPATDRNRRQGLACQGYGMPGDVADLDNPPSSSIVQKTRYRPARRRPAWRQYWQQSCRNGSADRADLTECMPNRISSSDRGRPDRFKPDQCPCSILAGRPYKVLNCNLNCNPGRDWAMHYEPVSVRCSRVQSPHSASASESAPVGGHRPAPWVAFNQLGTTEEELPCALDDTV